MPLNQRDEQDPNLELLSSLLASTSNQAAPVNRGVPPPPRHINSDGKDYEFTPGRGGSLIARAPSPTPTPDLTLALAQDRPRTAKSIPNYAEGGYVMSDEGLPDLKGDLTPGTSQQAAPVPFTQPLQTPAPAVPPVVPQSPPTNVPRGTNAAVPTKLPGMPASVTPDEIARYVQGQKMQLDKFGPQQQVDLENRLVDQRNSLGYKVADAGKGFADALMMGVAGAGNPNWQGQFENQQNELAKEKMDVLQKAHGQQLQDVESKMKLDLSDPTSTASKAYKASFAPVFAKMGYSPKDVDRMSGSQIATVADLGVRFADSQTKIMLENAWRQAELAIQQQNVEVNKMGKTLEEQKLKAEHPILNMLGGLGKSTDQSGGVPGIGDTFNGEKVMKVTRIK